MPIRIPLLLICLFASAAKLSADGKPGEAWWSLRPLPAAPAEVRGHPVDFHIDAALAEKGIRPVATADARALVRRLTFDLTGLPPSPEEADAFVAASSVDPEKAWEELTERLLAGPHYGERWARHWLDVVHYGDTHGYDKDQPRPHAWPYRDYVIRAFQEDKPYARFVEEQIAGDVLFPGTRDGIEALGFISAGPWDLIGHAEVPEEKTDGMIARHLDRDDMVANTMNTFTSVTVHCAQCHDHKFDPVSAGDYYALQAVFAAVDRADRSYDTDDGIARQRAELTGERDRAARRADALLAIAAERSAGKLTELDGKIAAARQPSAQLSQQNGWHSAIEARGDVTKWVQIDLGAPRRFTSVSLRPCHDDFNGIGNGFGFPLRFRIEAGHDPDFQSGVQILRDETKADFPNPGIAAVSVSQPTEARFIRVTAVKLAPRQNDFIFSLAELEVVDADGRNLAAGAAVSSPDSIEAPVRWQRTNLTDRWYPGVDPASLAVPGEEITKLESERSALIAATLGGDDSAAWRDAEMIRSKASRALEVLPAQAKVYCGTVHHGSGAFRGTGGSGGRPRPIHVLSRGDVKRRLTPASPGALSCLPELPSRFQLPADAPESERRAALARWITDPRNPLTWRSIVNRVWQYHFGQGLVATPSDFGRMGDVPSHPELLDWLACWFRNSGGSLKSLHRLMVSSRAYRRASDYREAPASDPENRLLWRMPRRKLEAEAIRDGMLAVSGLLDRSSGGPAFQDFVILHPEHSPHYEYQLADLANPALHRRSIYRFLVRSKPQPWMATMDCADPSLLVEKRTQTITPLQSLAQLNNQLTLVAAAALARRLPQDSPQQAMSTAFRLALQRDATPEELAAMTAYAAEHGLPHACRAILNLNEFCFVD
jgi:hypothetical protein